MIKNRFLCLVGIHDYTYDIAGFFSIRFLCTRCGKEKRIFYVGLERCLKEDEGEDETT